MKAILSCDFSDMPDKHLSSPIEQIIRAEVLDSVALLSPRQSAAIKAIYRLTSSAPSARQLAAHWKVTVQRVYQIADAGLKILYQRFNMER